jgi:hypothetical protein
VDGHAPFEIMVLDVKLGLGPWTTLHVGSRTYRWRGGLQGPA